MKPMKRRAFFPYVTGGVSGSFLLGTVAGVGLGRAGAAVSAAHQPWARQSHSQQGEDLIVAAICDLFGIEHPTYLDIGAADPCQDNNTYLFYERECRGVLVEPNPAFCRKIKAVRPGDTVLNAGVGVTGERETTADYYVIGGRDGDYLNSFSKEQVDDVVKRSEGTRSVAKTIKMRLLNINSIIEQYLPAAPSFVSIDTEGLDFAILQTLDFERFRPSILCVETLIIGTTRVKTEILDLMTSKGYLVRGGTFVNTIFVDGRLLA
jgi:FkbM family methyltransferase